MRSCSTSCPSVNQVDGLSLVVSTEAVAASLKIFGSRTIHGFEKTCSGGLCYMESNTDAVGASSKIFGSATIGDFCKIRADFKDNYILRCP